ncbi:MAG: arylesterase [Proteobacteria bacterium]|nr:arylesterase [Pseudomonadota bacterium]
MRRYLTFVFLLVTAITDGADAPTVLIYGDSLSAGYGMEVDQSWVALLQTRLQGQGYEHRVINASITGETTEGGAARIAQALDAFTPSLIILELGGNDGLRGIPPDRMKVNLQTIIQSSKSAGAAIVLLGIRIPPNYGSRYIEDFDNVYRELAIELDVPWIEFFMEGIALNDELMQADGIHPNAAAQPLLLDNAWSVISKALTN